MTAMHLFGDKCKNKMLPLICGFHVPPLSLSINIENSTQKKIVAQKTHLVFQCPAETVHRHAAVLRCYFKQTEWDLFSD